MKISFIIPVYNVQNYLDACIKSIACQTYKEFEVILVDDGSSDLSSSICDCWADKDERIRVIHKTNGGLSSARNAGVAIADGDYLIFVDSDDFWVSQFELEKLVRLVDLYPDCDFIGYNCSYYYTETDSYDPWVEYVKTLSQPVDKNLALSVLVSSGTVPMSACLKVISRKYIQQNDIHFINGIRGEDIPWFIELMDHCGLCMFVNNYIYAYRQNVSGSITSKAGVQGFNDLLNIISQEVAKVIQRSFDCKAKEALLSFLAYEFCILVAWLPKLPANQRAVYRRRLYEYKWLLKYDVNPKVKMVVRMSRILGIRVTEYILSWYLSIKK